MQPTDRRWTTADRQEPAQPPRCYRVDTDGDLWEERGPDRWVCLSCPTVPHSLAQLEEHFGPTRLVWLVGQAEMDMIAAAGRLADPQELERLRAQIAQHDASMATVMAAFEADAEQLRAELARWQDANEAACRALRDAAPELGSRTLPDAIAELAEQVGRLHARLAQLEQSLAARDRLLDQATRRVAELEQREVPQPPGVDHDPEAIADDIVGLADRGDIYELRELALSVLNDLTDAYERLSELTSPGRWELPAPPGPEVTEVWDVESVQWTRQHPGVDRWHCDEDATWESVRTWGALLPRGPLSATPPETAGGGQ